MGHPKADVGGRGARKAHCAPGTSCHTTPVTQLDIGKGARVSLPPSTHEETEDERLSWHVTPRVTGEAQVLIQVHLAPTSML